MVLFQIECRINFLKTDCVPWIIPRSTPKAGKALYFSENDPVKLFAQDLAVVIIHKAESVSVVWRAQIIPDTIGNIPFLQYSDHIPHPIFAPFKLCVSDRAELTAPKNFVGMLFYKFLYGG